MISKKIVEIENPISSIGDSDVHDFDVIGSNRENVSRSNVVWGVVFMVILLLLSRSFYLQVIRGDHYERLAENNRIRSVVVKAPRGVIKDRNGIVLARNVPSFDVVFVPAELPKEFDKKKEIASKIASVLGMNIENVVSVLDNAPFSKNPYPLKNNISNDQALILEEKIVNLPGVYIDKTARREYTNGEIFSPIVGYDGKITKEELDKNPDYLMTDYIGKEGVEFSYEKNLHGKHGQKRFEVDSVGQIKEDMGIVNPVSGDELVLNINAGLQQKFYEILGNILSENKDATGATAVAIDPRNGGVLALVSMPSYDNNLFAQGIGQEDYLKLINDAKKPLLNRAINGVYPPGSTFKPMMAAAALEEGVIREGQTLGCSGEIAIGQWKFPDWKTHGETDVEKAIAESCDVFFYAIGGGWNNIQGLGITRMAKYAKLFGFGEPLGIDIPGEAGGLVPGNDWKFKRFGEKWYIGDDYHASIGQGYVTATPLQLANSTAAIANGGRVYKPKLVQKIIHSDGSVEEVTSEIIEEDFISKDNMRVVREGMRQTVTDGSSHFEMQKLKTPTAGKTGTAQFGANNEHIHSWYISFAPYDNPEIAMVVLIEGGGEGHSYAVPATKEIYQWYFKETEEQDNISVAK